MVASSPCRMPRLCKLVLLAGATLAAGQDFDLGALLGGLGGQGKKGGGQVCKKGQHVVPRPLQRLKKGMLIANGCGPIGMAIPEPYGLWRCCNRHDVCFSSCSTSFQFCEKKFQSCMKKRCAAPENRGKEKGCLEQANSMSGMTGIFGSASHASTMHEVCDCTDSAEQAREKRKAWITDVYTRFGPKEKAEDGAFVDGLLDKFAGKEGELYYELITKYGGVDGFVEFDGIPNVFELEGPSQVPGFERSEGQKRHRSEGQEF